MANGNGVSFINKWWKLGVFGVAVIVAWVTLQLNVLANEEKNNFQDTLINTNATAIRVLNDKYIEDIATIKTQLQFISEQVKEQ